MFRHGHARRAVLLLIVLAAAFLWTADQGIRAAAIRSRRQERDTSQGRRAGGDRGAAGAANGDATQKAQQTTITDAAGRKHTLMRKVTQAEREAAADRLKAKVAAAGLKAPSAALLDAPAGSRRWQPIRCRGAMIPPGDPALVPRWPRGPVGPGLLRPTAKWAY